MLWSLVLFLDAELWQWRTKTFILPFSLHLTLPIQEVLEDAYCFCASLLRTQFTSQCHATSCIERALRMKCEQIQWCGYCNICARTFKSVELKLPGFLSIVYFLYRFSPFFAKTPKILVRSFNYFAFSTRAWSDFSTNESAHDFQVSFCEANSTWRNDISCL